MYFVQNYILYIMIQIVEYINKELRLDIELSPISSHKVKHLPSFLAGIYDFYTSVIYGQAVVFAQFVSEKILSPGNYAKHEKIIKRTWQAPVVFVFDHIESYNRSRMCALGLNFVVYNALINMPELFIIVNNRTVPKLMLKDKPLAPTAQVILLFYLYGGANDFSYNQLQNALKMPYPTVCRAIEQLKTSKLCKTEGVRAKVVHFDEDKNALLYKAIHLMQTPVQRVVYSQTMPLGACKAGMSALTEYSMINPDEYEHCAVSNAVFKEMNDYSLDDSSCPVHIEVWNYDPKLFAVNGVVDKISLYLSMKDNPDERIQYELINLTKQL